MKNYILSNRILALSIAFFIIVFSSQRARGFYRYKKNAANEMNTRGRNIEQLIILKKDCRNRD